MRPVLFEIPGLDIPIFAYGFMIMVGFLVAIFITTRRARRVGMDPNHILDFGIYLVILGVIGARLFFIIQFRDKFGFQAFNLLDGNFWIPGIILGLALGTGLYLYRKKMKWLKRFHDNSPNTMAFFAIIAIAAALVLGRAFYVALTPDSTKIVAVLMQRSDFYPDSFRAEPTAHPRTGAPDKRVTRVFGRVSRPGQFLGNERIHAYVFLPAHGADDKTGLTYEAAKQWLSEREIGYEELRPAYDLMIFEIWKGGLVYYGGVIGAIGAALLFAYRRKISFWHLADICAPGVAAGLACGRIGCFLNGCCWGKVTQSWWGMTFPPDSPAFDQHLHLYPEKMVAAAASLPVIPTQLMASFCAACLALVAWAFGRARPYIAFFVLGLLSVVIGPWRIPLLAAFVVLGLVSLFVEPFGRTFLKRNRGEEILLLGMLYPWVRFVLETLRADNEPSYLFGRLTISQSVGIFVFVGCLGVFVMRRLKGRGRLEVETACEPAPHENASTKESSSGT